MKKQFTLSEEEIKAACLEYAARMEDFDSTSAKVELSGEEEECGYPPNTYTQIVISCVIEVSERPTPGDSGKS